MIASNFPLFATKGIFQLGVHVYTQEWVGVE